MIKSMTGYGRAAETVGNREITVEIRSVNNRYLDCTVKLPRLYSFAEDPVKQRIKAEITRGKVDVFISVNVVAGSNSKVSLNRPVLEGYLSAMREMVSQYGVQDDISASALCKFTDVFVVEKEEEDEERELRELLAVVDAALQKHTQMRTAEGAAMEQDLLGRAATILELVSAVEARSPVTVAEYRERLAAKMKEVLENTAIDEGRILTEAAIFADKVAVDEETVRLRSHFDQLRAMLRSGGPVGRKLDFLLQEMNREANTIGSKGNDLEQTGSVVAIKAELEKIREQVQNIE
ncbi:MAG: YicC/YloC family endoribonuclease [Oscillospiraceae bacterium]|nr:YicC/YloC family endoribonuclease [Oscillospiraceae bacterium]